MVVRDARGPDPLDAHEDLQQIVEPRARDVLDVDRAHREVDVTEVHASEVTMVLGASDVEVRHVAAVVDDPLCVGLGEPDPLVGGVPVRRLSFGDVPELHHPRAIVTISCGKFVALRKPLV